jgi:hypothetical protein
MQDEIPLAEAASRQLRDYVAKTLDHRRRVGSTRVSWVT